MIISQKGLDIIKITKENTYVSKYVYKSYNPYNIISKQDSLNSEIRTTPQINAAATSWPQVTSAQVDSVISDFVDKCDLIFHDISYVLDFGVYKYTNYVP